MIGRVASSGASSPSNGQIAKSHAPDRRGTSPRHNALIPLPTVPGIPDTANTGLPPVAASIARSIPPATCLLNAFRLPVPFGTLNHGRSTRNLSASAAVPKNHPTRPARRASRRTFPRPPHPVPARVASIPAASQDRPPRQSTPGHAWTAPPPFPAARSRSRPRRAVCIAVPFAPGLRRRRPSACPNTCFQSADRRYGTILTQPQIPIHRSFDRTVVARVTQNPRRVCIGTLLAPKTSPGRAPRGRRCADPQASGRRRPPPAPPTDWLPPKPLPTSTAFSRFRVAGRDLGVPNLPESRLVTVE